MNDHLFNQNVALWAHANPKAVVFLPYTDCSHLEFSKTSKGELNLTSKVDDKTVYYHSNESPIKESQELFSGLDLSDTEVIYVYGVGLGYFYEAAKDWLKKDPHHHIVFLEDNLAVIHRLFETERGSQILHDNQVKLIFFENLDDEIASLKELYWQFLTTKMVVTALPFYEKHKEKEWQELNHKLLYDATVRHALLQEYLEYGIVFYRNFYPNLLRLPGASLGDGLAGQFRNVPAIICGAGPSLNKHIPLLKNIGDKALIFAGGSALNALNAAGIQPHLGAGVDPNPAQYERLTSNFAFELPFLYRNRMEYHAFNTVRGPRLYIAGSGGFDIAEWFEEQLGIKGKNIDEGYNVVNFCLDIARVWGCNPIIMVGMDLAFTKMHAYATGVVKEASVTEEEILSSPDLDSRALLRPDIYGNPVYTQWKWIAESQWISDLAKEHPDFTLINATEGGIGFPDIPNESLASVIVKHLKRNYELRDRLHGEIQNHVIPDVTIEKVKGLLQELHDSLIRCLENLETLFQEAVHMIEKIHKEKQMPAVIQSGMAALAEIEMAEEIGYKYVLDVFNVVYSKVLNRDLVELNWGQGEQTDWQQAIQRLELNNKKLAFLRDVARANVALIQLTLQSAH